MDKFGHRQSFSISTSRSSLKRRFTKTWRLLYKTIMLLHAAWLKNERPIPNGAGTAWEMTLVKEGLSLSPVKKSLTTHVLFLADPRLTERYIATELGISQERVRAVIHYSLEMAKVSGLWVQKVLGADQKRLQSCHFLFWTSKIYPAICDQEWDLGSPLPAWVERTIKAVEASWISSSKEGQVGDLCRKVMALIFFGFFEGATGGLSDKGSIYCWTLLRQLNKAAAIEN